MAIWRPFAMDTWNPLSFKFWSLQNVIGVTELEQFRAQSKKNIETDLPNNLQDPISFELLDAEMVVITPHGNLYNNDTLQQHWASQLAKGMTEKDFTCPLTNLKLHKTDFVTGRSLDDLKKILRQVKQEYSAIHKGIDKLSSDDADLTTMLEQYRTRMTALSERITEILETVKEISRKKDHLMLDIHNAKHLQFWQGQLGMIEKFFGNYKTVKDEDGKEYQIPEAVEKILRVADRKFDSKNDLEKKIKEKSANERDRFFAFRSDSEEKLLSNNVERVDLRKTKNNRS